MVAPEEREVAGLDPLDGLNVVGDGRVDDDVLGAGLAERHHLDLFGVGVGHDAADVVLRVLSDCLLDPPIGLVRRVIANDIEDEALIDGLAHRVQVEW